LRLSRWRRAGFYLRIAILFVLFLLWIALSFVPAQLRDDRVIGNLVLSFAIESQRAFEQEHPSPSMPRAVTTIGIIRIFPYDVTFSPRETSTRVRLTGLNLVFPLWLPIALLIGWHIMEIRDEHRKRALVRAANERVSGQRGFDVVAEQKKD
jgi:hypothetical protein